MSVKSLVKLIFLLLAPLCLVQCTKVAETQPQPVKVAQVRSPYSMPAEAYLAMANQQTGTEKDGLILLAAGRFVSDGQWQQAQTLLTTLKETDLLATQEKQILLAKIDMVGDHPKEAIARLARVNDYHSLPLFYQLEYHETLASAYDAVHNPAYAVNERVKLDHLLTDPSALSRNRRFLWLDLTKIPQEELTSLSVETKNKELQGWFELALIPKQYAGNEGKIISQVQHWQTEYSTHPANNILPTSFEKLELTHKKNKQVALIVPLTGSFAGPGGAVRDGFIAAQQADNKHQISLQLYDSNSADVNQLYEKAVADGADYVVGPLLKSDVAKIEIVDHPVPTLLLNDTEAVKTPNAYHFGLSPANEARQVAVKAGRKGLKRVLIITPTGSWGDEIVAAFTSQWRENGGTIVDKLSYDNTTDLSTAVREVLHVSAKDAKEKQFKPGSEEALQAGPKRRQDVDMIFLLAYPSKARQIMPLLKYYFAGDIPVYATSTVYAANTNKMRDRDLDGIIFCDMPWVFNHQLANKNWPEQFNSYNRLYALGMDSYVLSTQLNELLLFPAIGINDKNGILYLNQAQQVARIPAWGKFSGGIARLTNETI